MTRESTSLLTLPDEILLRIISIHLYTPVPLPRVTLTQRITEDPVALKLTCRRLNLVVYEHEKGKTQPVTMFISRLIDISDLLLHIKRNRVKRLIFTDTSSPVDDRQGDMKKRRYKLDLLKFVGGMIDAAKSTSADGDGSTIKQIKAIEFWPDTKVSLNRHEEHMYEEAHDDRESEPSNTTSFASTLFYPLATLSTILNIKLTLHTLQSTSELIIHTPLPPKMCFNVPLTGTPIISSPLSSELGMNSKCTHHKEEWTVILSPNMVLSEVTRRIVYFLHWLNRRRMRMSQGVIHTARVILKYEPDEVPMVMRMELVSTLRQAAGVMMGSSTVSSDLKGMAQIDISSAG